MCGLFCKLLPLISAAVTSVCQPIFSIPSESIHSLIETRNLPKGCFTGTVSVEHIGRG